MPYALQNLELQNKREKKKKKEAWILHTSVFFTMEHQFVSKSRQRPRLNIHREKEIT